MDANNNITVYYHASNNELIANFKADGSANNAVSSDVVENDGLWHHVCSTWNSTEDIKIYLDGTLKDTTSIAGDFTGSFSSAAIGNNAAGGGFWIGNIDEVRISNNARYTSAFTDFGQDGGTISSPTPFTSDANTLLLVHGEATAGVTGKVAQLNGWAVNY